MSDQATVTQTETTDTGAAAAEQTATQATPPDSSGQERAQEQAQPQQPKGPLSKRDARQGVTEVAKRYKERHQERSAESETTEDAPPEITEATEAGAEDVQRSTTEDAPPEVADQQDTETAEHPAWREGDPSGTYRDEEGRLRHATGPLKGKFAAPDTGGGEQAQDTEATAASERASDATPEAEAADETQPIRIEIPEGHAIREMGIDALTASDPQQEQALRALVNGTYHRRAEVEELREKLAEERRLRVQREASEAATEKWRQTPEYQQAVETYQQILDMQGEDAAKQYWQGASLKLRELADSEFESRWSEVEAEQQQAQAQQWGSEAWQRAQSKLPAGVTRLPQFEQWFGEEVQLLNARAEKGLLPPTVKNAEDLHQEFFKALSRRLVTEPEAVKVLKSMQKAKDGARETAAQSGQETQKAEEQAAKKAVEEFQKDAAQKRVETPPNPLAGVQHRAAPEGSTSVDTTPEEPDLSQMSPLQRKRHLRQAARQDAKRRFGPQ